jgi:hypothetical protein
MTPRNNDAYLKSPKSPYSYHDFNRPSTSFQITPASDRENKDGEKNSPAIKRRKSKREKSPDMKHSPKDYGDGHSDSAPETNAKNVKQRQKSKKKRVEPEGDIHTSFDEQNIEPRRFYLDQEHLTVPGPMTQHADAQFVGERRRYHSESGLIDTHIGTPGPPATPAKPTIPAQHVMFPIRRVQPSQDGPSQNPGSLDIGVIADSYM